MRKRARPDLATTLTGAAREARLQEGIAAVEQGLKANAESESCWRCRERLQREQAKTEKDSAVAASLRAVARAELGQGAGDCNLLLKQDYAALSQK